MSESDDSDFGAMQQKAQKELKLKRPSLSVNRQNQYSDDEDDEDDENEDALLRTSSNKKHKQTVEQKMAQMNHSMKISERKRQKMLKNSPYDSSDEDSSDDEVMAPSQKKKQAPAPSKASDEQEIIILEPDEPSTVPTAASKLAGSDSEAIQPTRRSRRLRRDNQTVVDNAAQAKKRSPRKPKAKPKPLCIEEIEISSSDEEGLPREISPTEAAAKQQLAQLQKARAQLEQPTMDLDDDIAVTSNTILSPKNELLMVTVDACVEINGTGSGTNKSIVLPMLSQNPLRVLEEALLKQLNLPSNGSTKVFLRLGSKRLLSMRTASFYELSSPVTIHATLYVTDFGGRLTESDSNFGPTLKLVLRKNGTDKTTVSYCLNQPFKDLIDAHGVLQFDGERLSPESTPASFDMESDDLIDVL